MKPKAPAAAVDRKGYNRRDAIPREVLDALNRGEDEPRTLSEWLAVDAGRLLRAVLPGVGLARRARGLVRVATDGACGPMERQRRIGAALFNATKDLPNAAEVFEALAAHRSGIVREWAALMVAAKPGLTLEARLSAARRFAADPSMNVREIAWVSYRPYLTEDVPRALRILRGWTRDPDPNIRRCAIESTRPRGVWCTHLQELKDHPEQALPLLEEVRSDANRYVQRSVANWLNDASKSQPAWVGAVCARWRNESQTPETTWIVTHAMRSIRKAGPSPSMTNSQ